MVYCFISGNFYKWSNTAITSIRSFAAAWQSSGRWWCWFHKNFIRRCPNCFIKFWTNYKHNDFSRKLISIKCRFRVVQPCRCNWHLPSCRLMLHMRGRIYLCVDYKSWKFNDLFKLRMFNLLQHNSKFIYYCILRILYETFYNFDKI